MLDGVLSCRVVLYAVSLDFSLLWLGNAEREGDVAAFARSHMISGSLPLESTIEQRNGTMLLTPQTIATANLEDQ